MPSLTIKNIPEVLLQSLRVAAQLHRRSINSEAIVLLEAGLGRDSFDADERLQRARRCRELTRAAGIHATTDAIEAAIDADRA